MTAAAIMLVLGVGDLAVALRSALAVRGRAEGARRTRADWLLAGAAWLLAAGGLLLTTGLDWASAAIAVAVAAAVAVLLDSPRRGVAVLGLPVAAVAIALAVLLDGSGVATGSAVEALLAATSLEGHGVTPSTIVLGAAALLFLGATSNALVRAVVAAARGADDAEAADARDRESWQLLWRGRELAVARRLEPAPVPTGFRGGRFVGPLERALVFAALLSGMPVVIAGLVAAKGVVRFPEISADRAGGSKAEEFLVGTLCSFLLAALGVLAVVAHRG